MKQTVEAYQKGNVLAAKSRERHYSRLRKNILIIFLLLVTGVVAGLLGSVKPMYAAGIPVVLGCAAVAMICMLYAEAGLYIIMFY